MSVRRRRSRNTYFYLEDEPTTPFGGLWLNPQTITNHDLHVFLDVLLTPEIAPHVTSDLKNLQNIVRRRESDVPLPDDGTVYLTPGDYMISTNYGNVRLSVTAEEFVDRVLSYPVTGRDDDFTDSLRARDAGCCILNRLNPDDQDWTGLEACHIWPLAKADLWLQRGMHERITDMPNVSPIARMNSPQNGLLMTSTAHRLFDNYLLGINPRVCFQTLRKPFPEGYKLTQSTQENYKIYIFRNDFYGYGGVQLAASARQNGESGARDELLWWHFCQCVLANMRGDGEAIWDYDPLDPGDVVGRILQADVSGLRLGAEIASRVNLVPYIGDDCVSSTLG